MVELLLVDVDSVLAAGGVVARLLKADDAVVVELFRDTADFVESVGNDDVSGALIVSSTVTGGTVVLSAMTNSVALRTNVDVSDAASVRVLKITSVAS